MIDLGGIIYAYHPSPGMRELAAHRTSASVPIGGRYRLIDFPLSMMTNADVRDVGVVMQRDYQSLLDHLGSGRAWDLARNTGGLRLLPPFGHAGSLSGEYGGGMEALASVAPYISSVKHNHIVVGRGNLLANVDLGAAFRRHMETKVDITAICADGKREGAYNRFIPGKDGITAEGLLCRCKDASAGVASLEIYIIKKELLLSMVSDSITRCEKHFHRGELMRVLENGVRLGLYLHGGYAKHVDDVRGYYEASMDMLSNEVMGELFPTARPVYTKGRGSVSTYYSEEAHVSNCLIADGCYVEGELEGCVLFRGVKVGKRAQLKNCIIMQDTRISENVMLSSVISDKDAEISPFVQLAGSRRLPLVIPKGSIL